MLGIVLGGIIGSRIRKKIDLRKLSVDQFLSFKINQIIKWTNKNQKKLDQLWYSILLEKVTGSQHFHRNVDKLFLDYN